MNVDQKTPALTLETYQTLMLSLTDNKREGQIFNQSDFKGKHNIMKLSTMHSEATGWFFVL